MSYHLTLKQAIEALSKVDPATPVLFSHGGAPGTVHSYRGYYSDLAFSSVGASTVEAVLSDLRSALDNTYEGYKGGEFVMDEDTPLWVSEYGESSKWSLVVAACSQIGAY